MRSRFAVVVFLVIALCSFASVADAGYFAYLTNSWASCRSNVLVEANARMATNSNDIVGAILRLEWDMAYGNNMSYSNAYARVVSIGEGISNSHFRAKMPMLRMGANIVFGMTAATPASFLSDEDSSKVEAQKEMNFAHLLEALKEDGLID